MIDLSTATDEEIEAIRASLAAREKRPGKAPALPVNAPPAPPPALTDAERIKALEQEVRDVKSFLAGVRSELWKEWQVVQDQVRAELHRLRAALGMAPAEPKNGAEG